MENKKVGKKRHYQDKGYFGAQGFKRIFKDKREKKKQRRLEEQQIQRGEKSRREDYELRDYKIGSAKFDEYYSRQFAECFANEQEFEEFRNTLQTKLPVTFRVNPGNVGFEAFVDMICDPNFIKEYSTYEKPEAEEKAEVADSKMEEDAAGEVKLSMDQKQHQYKEDLRKIKIDYDNLAMDTKAFYPKKLVQEMMIPKELLKKNEGLKAVHKIIDTSKDAGLLTRQELVSMLPPILADIHAHHSVLDMCAAPGSKTAQALEMIMDDHLNNQGKSNEELPRGFVVANDADNKRAYLLTHQINRFNTSNIMVTNHNAQEFPSTFFQKQQLGNVDGVTEADTRAQFDRIMCDVPCSSDAAIRKIPQKWQSWSPRDSQTLHPLQIKILQRGLELCKVGGKVSYSTCSLNPIEDEAVVAAILKMYGDKVKVLKTELPGFKFQPGLTSWKFLNLKSKDAVAEVEKKVEDGGKIGTEIGEDGLTYFDEFNSFEDLPEGVIRQNVGNQKLVRDSMFSSHYDESIRNELSKCLRVLPHHQNTSGFFITIIQKVKDFESSQLVEEKPSEEPLPMDIQKFSKDKAFQFMRCDPKDPDIKYLKAYFGLKPEFPSEQLVCQDAHMKKITFVSKELSDYLYSDCRQNSVNIINMGVHVFQRNQSKLGSGTECIFRVVQDGVLNILPYMTKRVIRTSNLAFFKGLFSRRYNGWRALKNGSEEDKKLYDQIEAMGAGCFVFVMEFPSGKIEALTMHKFEFALSSMISKEHAYSLQMRFLNKEERSQGCTILEKETSTELGDVIRAEKELEA